MFENNNYGNGFYPYNGYPYGVGFQQNPYYRPNGIMNPQPQAPAQPQQNTATNKLYASGIDDVRTRQLPNNSDYIFLDNDKPLIYRKTVDGTGKMEVQTFQITPYEEVKQPVSPQIDASQFVLRSDFEAMKKELEQKISSLKSTPKGGDKS